MRHPIRSTGQCYRFANRLIVSPAKSLAYQAVCNYHAQHTYRVTDINHVMLERYLWYWRIHLLTATMSLTWIDQCAWSSLVQVVVLRQVTTWTTADLSSARPTRKVLTWKKTGPLHRAHNVLRPVPLFSMPPWRAQIALPVLWETIWAWLATPVKQSVYNCPRRSGQCLGRMWSLISLSVWESDVNPRGAGCWRAPWRWRHLCSLWTAAVGGCPGLRQRVRTSWCYLGRFRTENKTKALFNSLVPNKVPYKSVGDFLNSLRLDDIDTDNSQIYDKP